MDIGVKDPEIEFNIPTQYKYGNSPAYSVFIWQIPPHTQYESDFYHLKVHWHEISEVID